MNKGRCAFIRALRGSLLVYLQENDYEVSMLSTVRKKFKGFKSAEIKRADAYYKALGIFGNPKVDNV